MKPSLHAQASAVDLAAVQARRRGVPAMKPKEWEHLDAALSAAAFTMLLIQAWRDKLPRDFIAEIEG